MSKNDFILEASPRADVGKGASRRLRRIDGKIPAIIYGAGEEPTAEATAADVQRIVCGGLGCGAGGEIHGACGGLV